MPSMMTRLSSFSLERFKTKVVRAGHYYGMFAERIEHDHLTVDVDHAGPEEFLDPPMELVLDVVRHQDFMAEPLRRLDAVPIQGDRMCIVGWI